MTRTRTPAEYDIVYEDPRPAPNAASGGMLYTVLEKLVADDSGQWARIAKCNSKSGANSILTGIKANKRRTPVDASWFEFTARTGEKDTEDEGKSFLYARFIGEEAAAAKEPRAPRRRRTPAAE